MILFLGPPTSAILAFLRATESDVVAHEDPLPSGTSAHHAVSHGYRHILEASTLGQLGCACINVHISLLPWNRGADPNLWSHVDDTPKGVSIHVIDAGVDTGPLVAQRAVTFAANATLRTSYDALQTAALALFCDTWPRWRAGAITPTPQPAGGSVHRSKDKGAVAHLLTAGWDTPLSTLRR